MRRRVRRLLAVFIGTFLLSIAVNLLSTTALEYLTLWPSILLLAIIVFVGVLFDVVGVAATAADEAPFHAMAVDRVPGSYQSVWLVRNADTVGTFCNDVVGDIAGTLSGAVGAAIVFALIRVQPDLPESLLTTVLVAVAAAATVGGKSFGKTIAIQNANEIIHLAGRLLHFIESLTGLKLVRLGKNKGRGKNTKTRRKEVKR